MGIYLYAIMAARQHPDLGRIGLPDGWNQVMTLPCGGLSAVIGEYSGTSFGELPRAELLRRLTIHQRVVERAMVDHPVLPVKFGTVLASGDELRAALDRWQARLYGAIETLGNAVEIELAATWEIQQTFAEIARQPQISALAASVAGHPADETVSTRIQIGKLVKEALDQRRDEYCQQIIRHLTPFARDVQPNLLASDELVLNVAFLVERPKLDNFYARVERVDEAFESRLTFRCIGPLPPYSFATVEMARPRPEEICACRRLLGLGERTTEAELNASYRRLAARHHPDLNPDDPTASERFSTLAMAHSKLLAYMRSRQADGRPSADDGQCDLSQSAVGNDLILAIVRSESRPIPFVEASRERDHAIV